jgi:predicted Mrr-cat superfamily restriction endonuclease
MEFIHVIQPFPHLAQTRAKLNAFTSDTTRQLQADVSNHQVFIRRARDTIAELRTEQAELRIQAVSVEEEMNRGQQIVSSIKREINDLREQSSDLPKRLHEIRERENNIRAEVQRLEAEVEKYVIKNEQDNSDLTQGVIAFKNRLGLDFQRIGRDQLKINMTNIDQGDPDRVFSFAVQIDPDDRYHVILCEPELPNTELLVNELNENNEFSKFVRNMRKAFRALAHN